MFSQETNSEFSSFFPVDICQRSWRAKQSDSPLRCRGTRCHSYVYAFRASWRQSSTQPTVKHENPRFQGGSALPRWLGWNWAVPELALPPFASASPSCVSTPALPQGNCAACVVRSLTGSNRSGSRRWQRSGSVRPLSRRRANLRSIASVG